MKKGKLAPTYSQYMPKPMPQKDMTCRGMGAATKGGKFCKNG
jgi:hypothetical protein